MEGVSDLKAWNVSLGIGSYVTMDFGEPVEVRISSRLTITRGQWHLWVQYSPWRIEARNKVIAGSDDPRENSSVRSNTSRGWRCSRLSSPRQRPTSRSCSRTTSSEAVPVQLYRRVRRLVPVHA